MKKIIIAFIVLILTYMPLLANQIFFENKYNINCEIPNSWIQLTSSANSKLTLINQDHIATINIFTYTFSKPVTINAFQEQRTTTHYDNWMSIVTKNASAYETALANADEMFINVYAKNILGNNLKITRQLIAEYFFLKGQKGYIISVNTQQKYWNLIKDDIKNFINSFWIGKGERPTLSKPENLKTEWPMVGQNTQNHNNILSKPLNMNSLQKIWQFTTSKYKSTQGISNIILAKNKIFFYIKNSLYCISEQDGSIIWSYQTQKPISKNLLFYEDILYFILQGSPNYLYAVFAENGNILFKKPLDTQKISSPIGFERRIYLIDGEHLKSLIADTGQEKWSINKNFDLNYRIIAFNNHIITIDRDSHIIDIDPNNGRIRWAKKLQGQILYTPIIKDNNIIICSYANSQDLTVPVIESLDINNGDQIWRYNQDFKIAQIYKSPAIIENNLFFLGQTTVLENSKQLLIGLNLSTGNTNWKYEFEKDKNYLFNQNFFTNNHLYLLRTAYQNETNLETNAMTLMKKTFLVSVNLIDGIKKENIIISTPANTNQKIINFQIYHARLILQQKNNSISLFK